MNKRIMLLRAGAIGDTLMVTPLVRAIRQTFPNAHLVFLCSRLAYDVLRYNPYLNQVIPLRHRHLPIWASSEKWQILCTLRRSRFDAVLVLESHKHFLDLAKKIDADRLIAYGGPHNGSRFESVPPGSDRHSIESHLRTGKMLGVQPAGQEMDLYYPPHLDKVIRQRLASLGISDTEDRLIGVHAGWGSRKQNPFQTRLRGWPPERFAQVIQWLVKKAGAHVVLTGSSSDRPLTEFIVNQSGVPVFNFAGKLSLLESAALIRRLNLYITIDSGPAHMAAALGSAQITLWGPAIFAKTAPLANPAPSRILRHTVPCAPCYGTPLKRSCRDNICMKGVEVDDVLAAIEEILSLSSGYTPKPGQK